MAVRKQRQREGRKAEEPEARLTHEKLPEQSPTLVPQRRGRGSQQRSSRRPRRRARNDSRRHREEGAETMEKTPDEQQRPPTIV